MKPVIILLGALAACLPSSLAAKQKSLTPAELWKIEITSNPSGPADLVVSEKGEATYTQEGYISQAVRLDTPLDINADKFITHIEAGRILYRRSNGVGEAYCTMVRIPDLAHGHKDHINNAMCFSGHDGQFNRFQFSSLYSLLGGPVIFEDTFPVSAKYTQLEGNDLPKVTITWTLRVADLKTRKKAKESPCYLMRKMQFDGLFRGKPIQLKSRVAEPVSDTLGVQFREGNDMVAANVHRLDCNGAAGDQGIQGLHLEYRPDLSGPSSKAFHISGADGYTKIYYENVNMYGALLVPYDSGKAP